MTNRFTIAAFVAAATFAFGSTALADEAEESSLSLAPAATEIVMEDDPDWQAIAWLLDEERASRVQDLLDELDFVATHLADGTTPLAGELSGRVADARAKVAGLWKVLGSPHDDANDADAIFAETAPLVAFVDEFVALTGVDNSADVERNWKYASRDFDDLRIRFGDS